MPSPRSIRFAGADIPFLSNKTKSAKPHTADKSKGNNINVVVHSQSSNGSLQKADTVDSNGTNGTFDFIDRFYRNGTVSTNSSLGNIMPNRVDVLRTENQFGSSIPERPYHVPERKAPMNILPPKSEEKLQNSEAIMSLKQLDSEILPPPRRQYVTPGSILRKTENPKNAEPSTFQNPPNFVNNAQSAQVTSILPNLPINFPIPPPAPPKEPESLTSTMKKKKSGPELPPLIIPKPKDTPAPEADIADLKIEPVRVVPEKRTVWDISQGSIVEQVVDAKNNATRIQFSNDSSVTSFDSDVRRSKSKRKSRSSNKGLTKNIFGSVTPFTAIMLCVFLVNFIVLDILFVVFAIRFGTDIGKFKQFIDLVKNPAVPVANGGF